MDNKLIMLAWIMVKAVVAVALVLILGALFVGTVFGHLDPPWLLGLASGMIAGAGVGLIERPLVSRLESADRSRVAGIFFKVCAGGLVGAAAGLLVGLAPLMPDADAGALGRKVIAGLGGIILGIAAPALVTRGLNARPSTGFSRWNEKVVAGLFFGTVLGLVAGAVTSSPAETRAVLSVALGAATGMVLGTILGPKEE